MNKVKCPKCGHMNHPSESHCSNCGYQLKSTKEASATSFLQSIYKTAMACPTAAGDVELNTKNRDKTIEKHNYGPLNLNDQGYWELIADKWNTTPEVAKKSKCGNCVAFDISPRMDDCMPGPVSDGEGRLGYCWMHHFKCHSARTCNTWAKGGPIKKDEASHDWQKKSKGMGKQAEDSSVKNDILHAFKAEGGALGMKALKKHVKAPDVQARLKDLMEEGRVYKHRHGDFIEKKADAYGDLPFRQRMLISKAVADKNMYGGGKNRGHMLTRKGRARLREQYNEMAQLYKTASAEYEDSHMLSKILMRMSAQSAHLKEKIDAGLVIPSWAEYKLYNAYSSLGSALGTAYPGEYEKEAAATATKTNPELWERSKQQAKARMGGKHSARAMQLATQIYKKKGGGYSGSKPSAKNNSLKKWGKQKWGYSGKDKPGQGGSGVYLPKKRREALKSTKKGRKMLASATRKKHRATAQGKQYSSHGLAAGTSLKKTASSSRVRSPHAYYSPSRTMPQPDPVSPPGNSEVLNSQAKQVAMINKDRTAQASVTPPPAPPSIQQNAPAVAPPLRPKYTGMP